jgi:hypothetical protein
MKLIRNKKMVDVDFLVTHETADQKVGFWVLRKNGAHFEPQDSIRMDRFNPDDWEEIPCDPFGRALQ